MIDFSDFVKAVFNCALLLSCLSYILHWIEKNAIPLFQQLQKKWRKRTKIRIIYIPVPIPVRVGDRPVRRRRFRIIDPSSYTAHTVTRCKRPK